MNPKVSRVLTIFKTHLDIGFTGLAQSVIRRYIDHYIPAAMSLAKETRGSPHRFVWTTGSWLVYHFFEEAGASQRRLLEQAVEHGDICWHALPFTTHTELMDSGLFRLGLRFSKILDARFGRKTIAAKMTDVPGHTKGMVPLLAEQGVRLLHVGVNPACAVPDVPEIFLWKVADSELVVIYSKDYGSTAVLPGGLALSINFTGDNHGPQNLAEVSQVFMGLQESFPSARVFSGSLDVAAEWVWKRRKSLPVVTTEIGDSWIHGIGTDPQKVSRFLALNRLRSKWIATGALSEGGPQDIAFGQQLLLVAEHTWGMDIKTHLHDEHNYSQAALRHSLGKPHFKLVAKSWDEQRAYIPQAIKALPAALAAEAKRVLKTATPVRPVSKCSRILRTGELVRLGKWELALDPKDGSIRFLREAGSRLLLADPRHRLAVYAYQTFSPGDMDRFYRQYCRLDIWWAQKDLNKPGLPSGARSGWHVPRVVGFECKSNGGELTVELRFSPESRRFGAPEQSVAVISPHDQGLDVQLQWFGKPANRMPESFWLQFNPRIARNASMTLTKLGLAVDPQDVVSKGNRHLHGANGPVRIGNLSIHSLDTVLVSPGKPRLLDFSQRQPDKHSGVFYNLFNNAWGTNFPQWYSDDALFRFKLRWSPDAAIASMTGSKA